MNRRGFFGGLLTGVCGLFFPQTLMARVFGEEKKTKLAIATTIDLAAAVKRIEKLERMVADTPQLWKPWPRKDKYGSWRNNKGELHNPKGPAIGDSQNDESHRGWYINGKHHRVDGPAVEPPYSTTEYASPEYYGNIKYYIDDKELTEAQFYRHPKCQIKRPEKNR